MKALTGLYLPEELKRALHSSRVDNNAIASADPYPVETYSKLVELIASIAIMNPALVPYYRGQNREYKVGADNSKSSVLPSIYRGDFGSGSSKMAIQQINNNFNMLNRACELVVQYTKDRSFSGPVFKILQRRKIMQWAILQHYEVCPTPLIDITQSLRIACMFAWAEADLSTQPVVYVIGMPYVCGPITFDAEGELYLMRLLNLMPPNAKRPFFRKDT